MDILCPHCKAEIEATSEMCGKVADCPACKCKISVPVPQAITPPPPVQKTTGQPLDFSKEINAVNICGIEKCTSSLGSGCLVQGIGVVVFLIGLGGLFTVIAPLICWPLALWLLIAGTNMATWHECCNCRGRVQRNAKICSNCKATLR